MANKKITDLPTGSLARMDDLMELVQDTASTPVSNKVSMEELPYYLPDIPPDIANAMDDEFSDPATLPGGGSALWAWRNQGTGTVGISFGAAVLDAPAITGDNLRIIEQNAPSAPWEFTAKISPAFGVGPANGIVGITAQDSGTKIVTCGFIFNTGGLVAAMNFNSPTSFAAIATSIGWTARSHVYFRLADDGTNLTFSFSNDGIKFFVIQTGSRTAFLASAATKIGLTASSENSSNGITNVCHWFRRTA